MKFLDELYDSIEKEVEHLDMRLASGIGYDFEKRSVQWMEDNEILSELLVHVRKINKHSVLSEETA